VLASQEGLLNAVKVSFSFIQYGFKDNIVGCGGYFLSFIAREM